MRLTYRPLTICLATVALCLGLTLPLNAQRTAPSGAAASAVVAPSRGGRPLAGPGRGHLFRGTRHHHYGRNPSTVFVWPSYFDDYGDDFLAPPVVTEVPAPLFLGPTEPRIYSSPSSTVGQISPGAKLIELPLTSQEAPSRADVPATMFLLKNGQRIEARRYTITGDFVYLVTGYQQTTRISVEALNLPATLEVNRNNGIDLRIPSTASELFLSY